MKPSAIFFATGCGIMIVQAWSFQLNCAQKDVICMAWLPTRLLDWIDHHALHCSKWPLTKNRSLHGYLTKWRPSRELESWLPNLEGFHLYLYIRSHFILWFTFQMFGQYYQQQGSLQNLESRCMGWIHETLVTSEWVLFILLFCCVLICSGKHASL